jgi:hypothetical protein
MQEASSLQDFRLKFGMHFLSLPGVLNAPPSHKCLHTSYIFEVNKRIDTHLVFGGLNTSCRKMLILTRFDSIQLLRYTKLKQESQLIKQIVTSQNIQLIKNYVFNWKHTLSRMFNETNKEEMPELRWLDTGF